MIIVIDDLNLLNKNGVQQMLAVQHGLLGNGHLYVKQINYLNQINLIFFKQCSVTCGTGIQRRTIQCNQDGRSMDKSKCPQPVPADQQTCTSLNSALCSTVRSSTGPQGDVNKF